MTDRAKALACIVACWACLAAPPAASADDIEFVPTLRALGTRLWNVERDPGAASADDDTLWLEVELPLVIRGPRWTGSVSYTPTLRQDFDDFDSNSVDHSLTAGLFGAWSQRTELEVSGRLTVTPEVFGLPQGDVAVPRIDLTLGSASVDLSHSLTRRDSVSFGVDASVASFSDGTFVDTFTVGASAGYSRQLTRRLALVGRMGGELFSFSGQGADPRSMTPSAGLRYQWTRETSLEVRAGASVLRGDLSVGDESVSLDRTEVAAAASLDHRIRNLRLGLEAERGFGSGGGLGQPFERTRLTGSLAYSPGPRWVIAGSFGVARNDRLLGGQDAALIDGLLPEGLRGVRRLDTLTGSGSVDYWVSRHLAIRGAYDMVLQDSRGAPAFDFDSHRLSVGIAWRPWNAPPVRGIGP